VEHLISVNYAGELPNLGVLHSCGILLEDINFELFSIDFHLEADTREQAEEQARVRVRAAGLRVRGIL